MTTLRPFTCDDLFKFNNVNFDPLTETYGLSFYTPVPGQVAGVLSAAEKRAYFVDLFVRKSNQVAINMYTNLGYIIYRTILDYYSGDQDEDAYDMRKALSRDVNKKSVIPYTQPVRLEHIDMN
ncbi:GM22725 [Drosophila sechellia]|uniref:GM22725 n=1 Tax=Drosophila sechellia TaxID=7238 RepID=B4I784_DROSE|nr:GM22725 [Drosophila sechellia]